MLELIAGIAVALAALGLVAQPLFAPRWAPEQSADPADDEGPAVEELDSPKIRALLALKEIEFDRATGKLSDDDYTRLKARYSAQAMAAIRAEEEAEATSGLGSEAAAAGDATEALIRRARARSTGRCPSCGPRPEPGAVFCSSCGRSLVVPEAPARCRACGEDLPSDARFCAQCGTQLAA